MNRGMVRREELVIVISRRFRSAGQSVGVSGVWLLFLAMIVGCDSRSSPPPVPVISTNVVTAIASPDDEALLRKLCTQCHLFADPELLAKSDWGATVQRMAQMPNYGRTLPKRISPRAITEWFEQRAPESLSVLDFGGIPVEPAFGTASPLTIDRSTKNAPFISQVRFVTLPETGERKLLACDMRNGWLLEADCKAELRKMRVFSDQVPHPARLEIVDLDGDGVTDFLVANLGTFLVMDHILGSVDWLRRMESGWERVVLADNLGRVADVKPFDADGDGDLDIAVAEFGWLKSGRVLLLENTTRKSQRMRTPQFTTRLLDPRHGAEQIEIADLNADGRPDIVALLAQEHEALVVYLNRGDGEFQAQELFRAPHPVWGYSGFQLLDFDGDRDLDALMTNGDMMDDPSFKPYHGVTWLENVGELKFVSHILGEVPGCHRAEAVDLDGDGDLDVVACALAPRMAEDQARKQNVAPPPALVWFEQTTAGQFQFHVWERGPGRYPTMSIGDADGDGKPDVALGIGLWDWPAGDAATVESFRIWRRPN